MTVSDQIAALKTSPMGLVLATLPIRHDMADFSSIKIEMAEEEEERKEEEKEEEETEE